MNTELNVTTKGRACTISICREEKQNSLNAPVLEGILAALDAAEREPQISVVAITGSGEKSFCAGADLSGLKNPASALQETQKYAQLLKRIKNYGKPTVALVNGVAMGGGLGLMLACDISLAHDEVILAAPEINVGLFPLMISPLIYQNVKSEKAANELMYSGRRIGAKEAYELGMISRLLPYSEFQQSCSQFVEQLAQKSAQVMQFGKESVFKAKELSFDQAVDELCRNLGQLLQKEDAQEGVRAFMEKRRPNFKF